MSAFPRDFGRRPPIAQIAPRVSGLAALGASIFVLAAVGHLLAERTGAPLWALALKPVPVLLLLLRVLRAPESPLRWGVAAGLVASAVGDVVIGLPGAFLAGVAFFLAAHIGYAGGFLRAAPSLRLLRAVPFALFGFGMAWWIGEGARELRWAVTVYIVGICLMMWRSAALLGEARLPAGVGGAALTGALFFAASDSLIAIHRFVRPLAWAEVPIMVLYWIGQAGIAAAAVRASRGSATT
ncbi:MAG: lysoplasmalogenase [Thermoanaerobaculia bacterium]